MIAVFGEFTGGQLRVGENLVQGKAGDVILLRGYDSLLRLPMPRHSTSPVKSGARFSVILNCISK